MSHGRCAYCSAPLIFNASVLFNASVVVAWRVGNRFVCNEFFADSVPNESISPQAALPYDGPKVPFSLN
jgi:hypothetical protein